MKYIILVLWTFSLFLLMFSSFPFRVECRPTRAGPGPPRPQQQTVPFNHHPHLLTSCPVLEGPSAKRFNPWPDLYTPDITVKVWESPIVLEGTARSRSEVRPDGTFGVTFDLHRVVKGDAPLLRRRRQFRLQFLENPDPSPDHFHQQNRDRDLFSGPNNRRNNNPSNSKNFNRNNNTIATSTTTLLSSPQYQPNSKSRSVASSNNNNNNNFNNVYNSHSNPRSNGGTMSSSTGRSSSISSLSSPSLNTKQLHQSSQLQLYHQQQSRTLSGTATRQLQSQPAPRQQLQPPSRQQSSSQFQQFRHQSPSSIARPTPRPTYYRNSSLVGGGLSPNSPFQVRPPVNSNNNNNNNNVNRNLGGSAMGRRSGRNAPNFPRSSPLLQQQPPLLSPKCLPPKATVKTGRKYYVFAAKVENHFIAVFSAELANKRNTKAVESILCPGCGQAPSVVAAKDVQLNVKERLRLRCRLRAGNPIPLLTWYKDGRPVNLTDTGKFRLRTKRRQSILVIRKARENDVGVYRCEAKNVFGSAYASVRVSLAPSTLVSSSGGTPAIPTKPKATTTTTTNTNNPVLKRPSSSSSSFNSIGTTATTTLWPLEARECPYDSYCLNGGVCSYFETIGEFVCQCAEGYQGQRCDTKDVQGSMYLSYFCLFGTNNPDYPCRFRE